MKREKSHRGCEDCQREAYALAGASVRAYLDAGQPFEAANDGDMSQAEAVAIAAHLRRIAASLERRGLR